MKTTFNSAFALSQCQRVQGPVRCLYGTCGKSLSPENGARVFCGGKTGILTRGVLWGQLPEGGDRLVGEMPGLFLSEAPDFSEKDLASQGAKVLAAVFFDGLPHKDL